MKVITTTGELPELVNAKTIQERFGFSRSFVYQLLNCPDAGAVQIGKRKFFLRDRFLEWLSQQGVERKTESRG